MVDKELISRKISQLRNYVQQLETSSDITWDNYTTDIRSKAFVERYLHLAIEKVFDISNHIISYQRWREPEGYRDLFMVLKEQGVLPEREMLNFQNMASFRNMLVHRYEKIDDEMVYGFFRKRLKDFDIFVGFVMEWIKEQDRTDSVRK